MSSGEESFKTPQKARALSGTQNSAHAFVGYKGGSGKTSLLFQTASQFAKENPETNVLVIDCSFSGDLSNMFLRSHGRRSAGRTGYFIIEQMYRNKQSTRALFEFLMEYNDQKTPERSSEIKSWLRAWSTPIQALNIDGKNKQELDSLNIADKFGVLVADYNSHITMENLYLIPSGCDDRQPASGFDEGHIPKLAKLLRLLIKDLPGKPWKIFFDTDGDYNLTKSLKVILRASDTLVTVTEVDNLGFRRIITLLEDLREYQTDLSTRPSREDKDQFPGVVERTWIAKLSAILFNKVEPSSQTGKHFDELGCRVLPHMKATRRLIVENANKFTGLVMTKIGIISSHMKSLEDLPPGMTEEERSRFLKGRMYAVIQNFKVPLSLSIDTGIPVCCMELNKEYKSDFADEVNMQPILYTLENERFLQSLIDNVDEIIERI